MFKKKVLAASIAALASVSYSAIAQDGAPVEEVLVTGIRASLQNSMDIKRDSAGVVDAISSEDIGKFPDSNLAESLQRITGVSISRNNGEGSQVTVRGFGAQFNQITLNGRTLPGGGAFGGGNNIGRSFDFNNLASESVSGLEVYKTGKANISSGGIGATVNINTSRPLDGQSGFSGGVGGKLLTDTTNRTGDDITPELSGIFSYADDTGTWGVSLSGSFQKRDSGSSSVTVNDWRVAEWVTPAPNVTNAMAFSPSALAEIQAAAAAGTTTDRLVNAPEVGALYALPNDVRYHYADEQRERINTQLTVQFAPTDQITITGDYTFAENSITQRRGDKTSWFTRTHDYVTFDTGQVVATPLYIGEDTLGKDHSFSQQLSKQKNTLDSIGLNLEFAVTDNYTMTVDIHDSTLESTPDGGVWGGFIAPSIATPVGTYQTYDFSGDFPVVVVTIDDGQRFNADGTPVLDADGNPTFYGNNNDVWDIGDIGSQQLQIGYSENIADVTQVKFDNVLEFDEGHFDFGLEYKAFANSNRDYNQNRQLGDWGVTDVGNIDSTLALIENFNYIAEFNDFSTNGLTVDQTAIANGDYSLVPGSITDFGVRADAEVIGEILAAQYGRDFAYDGPDNFAFNNIEELEEDSIAAYFQLGLQSELGGLPVNFLAGLRYEGTDSTSTSFQVLPGALVWTDNNDFRLDNALDDDGQPIIVAVVVDNSYNNLLPSLDMDIGLTDDIKARFSYSQTIARPSPGQLRAGVTGFAADAPTLTGGTATASSNNPSLVPLLSNNVDLSVEWYFDDTSYVSGGFYEKRVINFIGSQQVNEPHFDLRDATAGPRALAAADALTDLGVPVTETSLFVMTVVLDNPTVFLNGAADYAAQDATVIAANYDVEPDETDPLIEFVTAQPLNTEDAQISGFELAVQHFFGETGFGIQANYTTVNGDVAFDNGGDPSVNQFALVGLSDTANLVFIYENFGLNARLAYNWRDEFLSEVNVGPSRSPRYVEAFSQIDVSVGYDVLDNLTVFFEGINITEEDSREHGRTERQIWNAFDLGARYSLGARYTF
jgi:TonB-dependent receptor